MRIFINFVIAVVVYFILRWALAKLGLDGFWGWLLAAGGAVVVFFHNPAGRIGDRRG